MTNVVRVRVAPSPTGEDLHIGTANTGLVNYLFAKKNNGKFIVRLEDTDQTRLVPHAAEKMLASLKWLGINYDEGPDIGGPYAPYEQSKRLSTYREYVDKLIGTNHAYYCFCSQDRLAKMRSEQEAKGVMPMYDGLCKKIDWQEAKKRVEAKEPHVVRLNVPDEGETKFTDLIRGEITFENRLIDDQVLLKSDGFPTYHLAVVVDDHLMEISHIIRGEDWISSTPKHVLLYQYFGWELPQFTHVPLLRNPDKSKLSKRKNPVWISWYRSEGFLPEVLVNYMGLLIWSRAEGNEIFNLEELIQNFDLAKINPTGPAFDFEKLRWLNGVYIRNLPPAELVSRLIADGFVRSEAASNREYLTAVVKLTQERLKILSEFPDFTNYFFVDPQIQIELMEKYLPEPEKARHWFETVIKTINPLETWQAELLEAFLKDKLQNEGLTTKDAFMGLRVALTGVEATPPLFDTMELLGKEVVLKRLHKLINE